MTFMLTQGHQTVHWKLN